MKQLFPLKRDGPVAAVLLGHLTPDAPARDCGVPWSVGERGHPRGDPKVRGSSRVGGCEEGRSSGREALLRFAAAGSAETGGAGAAGISMGFRGTAHAFKPPLEQGEGGSSSGSTWGWGLPGRGVPVGAGEGPSRRAVPAFLPLSGPIAQQVGCEPRRELMKLGHPPLTTLCAL